MENELKNEILKAIDFEIKTIEKATKAISFLKIIEPKFRIGENVLFPESSEMRKGTIKALELRDPSGIFSVLYAIKVKNNDHTFYRYEEHLIKADSCDF
tara:strand:+ start:1909 stop:2205 length:297 start_codon:yes stop_codon:yes gene_type:complete